MVDIVILKRAGWPPALRASWEAGVRPPVLLNDPCGAGGRWRRQTVRTTEASLGRYFQFAREKAWPIDADLPTRLVTRERLQSYLAHLAEQNAPATVLHRIIGLERGLAVLAPKSNRSLLRLVISDLEDHFEPASKRERLQETAALVALGFRLMNDAKALKVKRRDRRAVLYRNGFKTALLARRPIRLRNLSMMHIGKHLVKIGGLWRMQFAAHEVKNKKPIDVLFPEDLIEALELYLREFRVDLGGSSQAGSALWVSARGAQLSARSIHHELCKVTKEEFDLPISPHLFRDCAATSLAVHAPEIVNIAHLVLGNTYAVMERHYNLARVVEAGYHFYEALGLD